MFDIILEQGLIHDGTGEEPFVADIGITGKKIVAVADLSEAAARDRNVLVRSSGHIAR